jgi:ubiquinone/menaquinone biosynthesis C-methylase UbiE
MPDFAAIKSRQRDMWALADYASVGARILLVSELLCEAVNLQGGERVLDVACGNGNTALAAARRFATVIGTDYQPRLLDAARKRAEVENLPVRFEEADVENLPYDDDAFDVVTSTCGAMFAPDQQRTADELIRVCRPGGRIGMVNWTPQSWVAEVGRTVGRYVPPPEGVPSPVLWGDPDHVAGLFGDRAEVTAPVKQFRFRFASTDQHVDYFCENYPPFVAALRMLDGQDRDALRADLAELAERFNIAEHPETLILPLEYIEVVAVVR